jgi:serine/threonine-protein kinase
MSPQSQPSSTTAPPIAPGTLIADRYRVDAMLGEGAMGAVYLAEHVQLRKRLAIKVLLPQWTTTAEVVARFEQEAVAAGAISHPNVAAATDFGRLADGSFFLVLEYLEGRTLRAELAAGPLPTARALMIARGIALGVAAAHAKGIVHRDLKPENAMLVTRDGDPDFVKVLDFGIARIERTGPGGQALTSAGAVLGTPHYMAPEQALGSSVDARADLYALGVMLFEMLTGECPFRGAALTLVRQHLLTPAPALPPTVAERVPSEVRSLVARLLEKEPAARYASAAEVVLALNGCLAALAPSPARTTRVVVADGALQKVGRATAWARGYAATRVVEAWRLRSRLAAVAALGRSERARRIWARLRQYASRGAAQAVALWRRSPRLVLAIGAGAALLGVVLVLVASRAGTSPPRAAITTNEVIPPVPAPEPAEDVTPPASDAVLSCLDGKFADRIEQGNPAGDAKGIASARKAIYWLDLANRGRPTQVTLVWRIDGKEVQRQMLDVGHAPHWRTWGVHKVAGAHEIEVRVLDATGHSLKEDSVTFDDG